MEILGLDVGGAVKSLYCQFALVLRFDIHHILVVKAYLNILTGDSVPIMISFLLLPLPCLLLFLSSSTSEKTDKEIEFQQLRIRISHLWHIWKIIGETFSK